MKLTPEDTELEALKILANVRELDPEIIQLVNRHFWNLLANDAKSQDSWRGADERPDGGALVCAYYQDFVDGGKINKHLGTYAPETKDYLDKKSPYGFAAIDSENGYVHWDWVVCWKAFDPGPMPERFKIKEETK